MSDYWVIPIDGYLTSRFRNKANAERLIIRYETKIGPFDSYDKAADYALERDYSKVKIVCEEAP